MVEDRIDLPGESLVDRGEILPEAGEQGLTTQSLAHADPCGGPRPESVAVGTGGRQFVDEAEASIRDSPDGLERPRLRSDSASGIATADWGRLTGVVETDVLTLWH
jgi:hypothetical protein